LFDGVEGSWSLHDGPADSETPLLLNHEWCWFARPGLLRVRGGKCRSYSKR
jgi:hypothetical protein